MADSAALRRRRIAASMPSGDGPMPLHRMRSSSALRGAARRRAVRALSGLPDEGAVLRAVRLRLQPAARLCRAAVLRPRRLFRHRRATSRRYAAKVWGLTPELAILLGTAVAGGCSGSLFGALAIRRQGIYFAMITLALAQMVYFFSLQAPLHRRRGRHPGGAARQLFGLLDLADDRMLYYCRARDLPRPASLLIYRIIHSPFGQVLKAIRENEPRAISLGYRVEPATSSPVFVLSAALAGLAGATKAIVFQLASLTDVHWTHVGRGRADDAARRHGHGLRPDGRRRRHRHDAELPRRRSAPG